jgi:hypothetical protein
MKKILCLSALLLLEGLAYATLTDGLVAYYPFNGNANDESGNGNHGTVAGNAQIVEEGIQSGYLNTIGNASEKSTSGGHLIIPDISSSIDSEFTISFWVQNEVVHHAHGETYISLGTSNAGSYLALTKKPTTGGLSFQATEGNASEGVLGISFDETTNLKNILIRYSGNSFTLYINGEKKFEELIGWEYSYPSAQGLMSSHTWSAGIHSGTSTRMSAEFDGIRIYNRALSEEEVAELYDLERPDLEDGLVAYYPFNGNANDASGNGNDGTVNGATLTTDRNGVAGSAYGFDGNDYVAIPDSSLLEYEAGSSLSISAWIKVSDIASRGAIYSNYRCVSESVYFEFTPDGRTITLETRDSDGVIIDLEEALNDSSLDQWVHLTGVRNYLLESISFYLNGALVATDVDTRTGGFSRPGSTGQHWIGAMGKCSNPLAPQYHFNGKIDDVRIYNRALSSSEVAELYDLERPNLEDGLVAYYPFNGNANDESGNGNDGTVNGATLTTDRNGEAGSAYSFDGVNDKIDTGNGWGNFGTGPVTISVWIKRNEIDNVDAILSKGNYGTGKQWYLRTDYPVGGTTHTHINFLFRAGAPIEQIQQIWSTSQLYPGTWHHVVAKRDSTGLSIYIDGQLDNTEASSPRNADSNVPVKFGFIDTWVPGDFNMDGNIDDVRIYNRALSSSEVAALYDLERPNTTLSGDVSYSGGQTGLTHVLLQATGPAGLSDGLVGYYPFTNGSLDDSSGQGNHGTAEGAPIPVNGFDGLLGGALAFDGDDAISVGNILPNYAVASFTAWIKADASGFPAGIVSAPGDASGGGFRLGIQNLLPNVGFQAPGVNSVASGSLLSEDQWYFAAVTVSQDVARIYIDGEAEGSFTFPTRTSEATTESVTIGKEFRSDTNDGSGQRHFKGTIDEVRVYNRALSAAEIQVLYTLPGTQSAVQASPGPYVFSNLVDQVVFGDSGGPLVYALSAFMDTDGNTTWDSWEPIAAYSNNPFSLTPGESREVDLVMLDPDNDGDGLAGYLELFTHGTSDDDPDSDDDGFDDGFEVAQAMDPLNPSMAAITQYIRDHGNAFDLYPSNMVLNVGPGEILIDLDQQAPRVDLWLYSSGDLETWNVAPPALSWDIPIGVSNTFYRMGLLPAP